MAQLATGTIIEDNALEFLQKNSVKIIQRNYHCKFGEIDLIGLDRDVLAFIEVRFRKNDAYGCAAATVDWRKQQKIVRSAQWYLLNHASAQNRICRFDVVAISNTITAPHIEWIKDAFHAPDA